MNSASPELKLIIQLLKIKWGTKKHTLDPRFIPYIIIAGVTPNAKLHTFSKAAGSTHPNTTHALQSMIRCNLLVKNNDKDYSLTETGKTMFDTLFPKINEAANNYRKAILTKLNKPLKLHRLNPSPEDRNKLLNQIIHLHQQGFSQRAIARQLNIPKSTVHYYLSHHAQAAQNGTLQQF